MGPTSFRVDSALARACVGAIGFGTVAGGVALFYRAASQSAGTGVLATAVALALVGALFARAAVRWNKVIADRDGLVGLEPELVPWSRVDEIWETYLSQRQPWPQRMVVRTSSASYRIWTTRPAIARCRELAGLGSP